MEGIRKTSRESCGFPCVFHYRSPHFPHFSHKLPVFHEIFICFSSNPNQIPKHPAWACAMMNPQSRKTPIKEEPVMSEQRPYPSQEKQSGQSLGESFFHSGYPSKWTCGTAVLHNIPCAVRPFYHTPERLSSMGGNICSIFAFFHRSIAEKSLIMQQESLFCDINTDANQD